MEKRKIVFLSSTRADFGKIKSLLAILQDRPEFDVHIFATGMHLNAKYGSTVEEIEKFGAPNIFRFINHTEGTTLDTVLAKTISGFGEFVRMLKPDMIVVHGDRVEALAGALVGSLNNTLVAHIEGGEISGTIDELIRHAVSKMSHLHFVANEEAKRRLLQMGERQEAIFVIGSPDLDLMESKDLPTVEKAKKRYDIPFNSYSIFIFHPVTTEVTELIKATDTVTDALVASGQNFISIYPNADPGTDIILGIYKQKLIKNKHFVVHPSLSFESFLSLLKGADCIVGNSSAGIREAPYYGVPTINIGSRQNNRAKVGSVASIFDCGYDKEEIMRLIMKFSSEKVRFKKHSEFGSGNSDKNFLHILLKDELWKTNVQKQFVDF